MNDSALSKSPYIPFTGSPRAGFAREAARRVLCALNGPALPVDPRAATEVLRETGVCCSAGDERTHTVFPEVACIAYTRARDELNMRDPLHLRELGADARTVYDAADGRCTVVWDDEKGTPGRRRFTLAHECGHIALGHFTDINAARMLRAEDERGKCRAALEKEADIFAAELLCPGVLVRECLPGCGAHVIAAVFGVSMQCAEARLKENAAPDGTEVPAGSERAVLHLYRDALEQMREIPVPACEKCGTLVLWSGQRYCTGCGAVLDLPGGETELAASGHLPPRLPDRRLGTGEVLCLSCGSIAGRDRERCSGCGTPLFNRCLRCGKEWPDGCAFCPDCGMECALGALAEENVQTQAAMERRYPPTPTFSPYPKLRYARAEALRRGKTELAFALRCARLMETKEHELLLICKTEADRRQAIRNSGDLLDILDEFSVRHPCIGIYADGEDLSDAEREPAGKKRSARRRKPGTEGHAPERAGGKREKTVRAPAGGRSRAAADDTENEDTTERDEINAILSGKDLR